MGLIIGVEDVPLLTGQRHAFLTLDSPQRVWLRHCADRFNRFRSDPVHQRIDPNAVMRQIVKKARLHLPVKSD